MSHAQKRYVALDVFRGIAVLLALLQHYGYMLSIWFSGYVKPFHFNDPSYSVHHKAYLEGRQLPIGLPAEFMMENLGTWASHLYLFLAGFNICMKSQEQVNSKLKLKLQGFFALFLFFTLETAIVSTSFGESFSVYPIQMWMIVLAMVNLVYAKWGVKALLMVFLLSFLRFVLPVHLVADALQNFMVAQFHSHWEYDARIEYFIGTGALGALAGYGYSNRELFKKARLVFNSCFALSFAGIVLYQFFGVLPHFEENDYYSLEHFFVKMFPGTLYIYCCCVFLTTVALAFENAGRVSKVPILYWVGTHSLFVFAFHRILFVHVSMPTQEWFATKMGHPIEIGIDTGIAHVLACLLLTYFLMRFRVIESVVMQGRSGLQQ